MSKQPLEAASQNQSRSLTANSRLGATTGNVVARLRSMILEGQYSHDERLPPERLLADEFQVSRGTIRSVLQVLQDQQLVTRRVGSGTYVNLQDTPEQYEISSITSPVEMVEVRIAVEPQMVRLAIINASHRDLQELHKALLQCENCGGNSEKFAQADTAFHLALARCSKNKLLFWVYERISKVRQHAQWRNMKAKLLTPGRIDYYNTQHRAIYDAIVARDATEANKLIKNHLYGVQHDLLEP
ncbi:MAG: GntR family transcriptional repressor for pyruvate dehydrogenase complex [Gammaproteobacteria bacterium]|jgi:GntR family transcriptional repressor for pyruvate dehydrogenase complex